MKKINDFVYENEGGVRVKFISKSKTEESAQKYSFLIVNDEELTQKLLKIIIKKSVKFGDIFYMARVIFDTLRSNDEYLNLQKRFVEESGYSPEFEIISKPNRITAILKNKDEIIFKGKNEVPFTGQASTEICAKIRALRNFFKKI